ncbi:SDR family NAD(P)-dependent oxidoreductase [Variovorax sp. YR216]|uniref:SDR family NAD(P)-dependent oxidoreductase n=1 Tax=Variovorax sp. YR216 TaxID=1882828 RepID=UPI000894F4E3|nr:SDR family oxidoreductase [Variovorax sp. YR216]SEB15470.1 NAD(P)-dependent dehydrogenase, short-chain alcohol dehydrogenase family [Variovorax sp. YR216]
MTASTTNRRHALVTGGPGGIGRGICFALIEQAQRDGAAIHVTAAASQPGDRLDRLVDELRSAGATATGVAGDLTDPACCADIVRQAIDAGGDLTALVCNAGASGPGRLADLPTAQWDRTFDLNVRAVWLLAQSARPSLARTGGSITAIASMSGHLPHPGYGAYSAAKAALVMLCRQLAQEWAADGVRVNSVSPGMIRTPLTEAAYEDEETHRGRRALVPLGRIGTVADIGATVAFLAGTGAAYITGQSIVVDGGISDRMLGLIPGRPGKPAIVD